MYRPSTVGVMVILLSNTPQHNTLLCQWPPLQHRPVNFDSALMHASSLSREPSRTSQLVSHAEKHTARQQILIMKRLFEKCLLCVQ